MAVYAWNPLTSTAAAKRRPWPGLHRAGATAFRYLVTALFALAVIGPAIQAGPASARTVHGTYGGNGDATVVDECPRREFLVGVKIRAGAWMDQIQVICQLRGTFLSTSTPFPPRGGNGGAPQTARCPNGKWVVGAHWYITSGRQVLNVELTCANLVRGSEQIIRVGGSGRSAGYNYSRVNDCPQSEAGTGFTIRFGRHVNALGLVCDVRP